MTIYDFSTLETVLQEAVQAVTPAAQLVVRKDGAVVFSRAAGFLDPETRLHPTRPDTRFDLASVTKLFVVSAFMSLVETGQVGLDQPVHTLLPEFSGLRPVEAYEDPLAWDQVVEPPNQAPSVDAGQVTFRNLISHNAGLPAWRPLFRQPSIAAARAMALSTPFFYPVGERVVYSDIGLILLGMAIERLAVRPLDQVVKERVLDPLGLEHTGFLAGGEKGEGEKGLNLLSPFPSPLPNIAPTEFCHWRNRRIRGEVHDENAYRLGGVAGHAGLFSTASDVARFGQAFLDGGRPVLSPASVAEMTRFQAGTNGLRRGLGFVLWSPDPEASSNPFSPRAFGHTGFTGTSLWIDPERSLVVALLTNEVYNGREGRSIMPLRVKVHRAVVDAV